MSDTFHALVAATWLAGLLALVAAYVRSRDSFHPLVIACPVTLFFFGYMPLKLEHDGMLTWFVSPAGLVTAQTVFLVLLMAFYLGGLLGSGSARWSWENPRVTLAPQAGERLFAAGVRVGSIGIGVWLLLIVSAGGFSEVYGVSYGGGELHTSGWVRETNNLYLTGLLLCLASGALARGRGYRFLVAGLFALPHVVHALLGARRGPTFVVAVLLYVGWHIFRNRRPAVLASLAGGLLLGVFLIFLVGNRDFIYLGSKEDLDFDLGNSYVFRFGMGNEYVVASGLVLTAQHRQQFGWGVSFLEQLLLRPIPKELLPNKYEILPKQNVSRDDIATTIGWWAAEGSAPTLFGQLFTEFGWAAALASLLIGWVYGWGWRRAVTTPSVGWQVLYVLMVQGLLHLLAQDFWAMAVPFLLMFVPAWLCLVWAVDRPFRPLPRVLGRNKPALLRRTAPPPGPGGVPAGGENGVA